MARMRAKDVIQAHHISYEPEITAFVRRTEHFYLTRLQQMSIPTKGFIKSLKYYILQWEGKAISGEKYKESYAKLKEDVKKLGNKYKKTGKHIRRET